MSEIFRSEYMRVTEQRGDRVAVQVGDPPEEAPATVVDAEKLVECLNRHLLDQDQGTDGDSISYD